MNSGQNLLFVQGRAVLESPWHALECRQMRLQGDLEVELIMATTTTVRIGAQAHATLSQLAVETGQTMQEVLARAIEAYQSRHFIEQANAEYAALRDDPAAWQEELAERAAWDLTATDDLEDEA